MDKFPQDIQMKFYKVLYTHELPISELETWLYNHQDLEEEFGEQLYFELISMNYQQPHAKHELQKILQPYLDYGQFEEWKLRYVLQNLIEKNDRFTESLAVTYDMYCNGYEFLRDLALGYALSLSFDDELIGYDFLSAELKAELNAKEEEVHPEVKILAEKILKRLNAKELVLTDLRNEID